jgi:hypothetical protein
MLPLWWWNPQVTERNSSAPDTEREIVSEHKALDKLEWLNAQSPQEYRRIAAKLAGDK